MTPRPRRRALLIGTEHHEDTRLDPLPCTRADTAQLAEVLRHPQIGGYDVRVENDLDAAGFRAAIAGFLDDCEENELALVYLSGHGARCVASSGEFFFAATDTNVDELARTGVGARFVNQQLEDCHARQKVAILDCCYSGGFALGFRASDAPDDAPPTKSAAPAGAGSPLTARGVYVLSSSAVDQESFGGNTSSDTPQPSVFTAAVVQTLRTGAAGGSAGGDVSAGELFDAVADRLRQSSQQRPVVSSLHVEGRIYLAGRPHGPVPAPAVPPARAAPATPSKTTETEPGWPQLLGYYRDAVKAGMADFTLLRADGREFACLPGTERLLATDLDSDGCVPVPPEVGAFVDEAARMDRELWAGWPAVVLTVNRQRRVAPLLIRRVTVETDEQGAARLQPEGAARPHPKLTSTLLDGDDAAALLAANYQPSWRPGERDRLADDASQLLAELEVSAVQELRPAALSDRLEPAGPADGAQNVAILFATTPNTFNGKLRDDLEKIGGKPERVTGTALAALLDDTEPDPQRPPTPVTPMPANASQREVLRAAMSRRLTATTGPPGTGKSQLIVNVVATAIAAGQSVLVASTNNAAVDEVCQRCDTLVPGSLIRTGSGENRTSKEPKGLKTLLDAPAPDRTMETLRARQRSTDDERNRARRELAEISECESRLIAAGRDIHDAAQRLGVDTTWRPTRNVGRARSLAGARIFGKWRRRRLLHRAGLPDLPADTVTACRALADFTDAVVRRERLERAARKHRPDDALAECLRDIQDRVSVASTDLLRASVHAAARTARDRIEELSRVRIRKHDWSLVCKVLPHARAWAVTCKSARRFPPDPGLFDLVVIDEASQCSIPQVVPLLFRAERALVVGDLMQLPHISDLARDQERELRHRHGIGSAWLEEHELGLRRHSAFHAARTAAGPSLLLDEHFRCHPTIAYLANRLFYGGHLAVLTDVRGRPALPGRPIQWIDVQGRAERVSRSWRNLDEADDVVCQVERVRTQLPAATIGVVTPYAEQRNELTRRLRGYEGVLVGTIHTFQGGERDIMIFSLVAGRNVASRKFNWFDSQRRLWNVAITRARSNLIVVGDLELWCRRGGVGARLAAAADADPDGADLDDELAARLYAYLQRDGREPELGTTVNGYPVDAVCDGSTVLLDTGSVQSRDQAVHLERMLRRRRLLAGADGRSAHRLPFWMLGAS